MPVFSVKTCTNKIVSCFALVSDFGVDGPYLGQLHAALINSAPHIPTINLLSDAPAFNPRATAYLLYALSDSLPKRALFLSVIDPGVGSDRMGLIVETDSHVFVGPDNGLLSQVVRRSNECQAWIVECDTKQVSPTFHGRDVFAPIAASLANGEPLSREPMSVDSLIGWDWPAALYECIYIDHYGNIFTGLSEDQVARNMIIIIRSTRISFARTFSDVLPGEVFWYVNSCGLIEIAANMARANELLGIKVGEAVTVEAD